MELLATPAASSLDVGGGCDNEEARLKSERYRLWLGVTDQELEENGQELEEYIVLKSIFDQNLAKLKETDQVIFKSITTGIF